MLMEDACFACFKDRGTTFEMIFFLLVAKIVDNLKGANE